jgi:hypothetical protein
MNDRAARVVFGAVALTYVAWAAVLIARSAIVVGGKHYFCLFDDAMISLRYAWNLSHGNGLVWNAGDRVEGITNLLMTLYMAIGTLLFQKRFAALFVQLSGIGFALGAAWLAVLIRRELGERRARFADALVFVATLAYYPLSFWTLMGMETGLLTVLVFAATWLALRDRARFNPWVAIFAGLAFMTRPEAAVQGVVLVWFHAFDPKALRTFAREAAIFGGIVGATTLFRVLYYGAALPNTYALKVGGWALSNRLANGWVYVRPFLATTWPAFAGALAAVLTRRRLERALVFALPCSVTLYQVWVGGDPWFYWRILAPYVPLLFILVVEALADLTRAADATPRALRFGVPAVTLATALYVCDRPFWPQLTLAQRPYGAAEFQERNVRVGLELERLCTPDARVGVVYAGALVYYSGLRGVDFLGKSDPIIARLRPDLTLGFDGLPTTPGHNKYDLRYSIEVLAPDVLEIVKWGHDDETSFVRAHYAAHDGLWFKKDSPRVRWELLDVRR